MDGSKNGPTLENGPGRIERDFLGIHRPAILAALKRRGLTVAQAAALAGLDQAATEAALADMRRPLHVDLIGSLTRVLRLTDEDYGYSVMAQKRVRKP